MVRGLGFTAGLTVLIALLLLVPPTYCSNPPCAHSSSCGNIPNISFPFRLNSDPQNCGDSSGSKYFQAFSHVQLMVFDLPHIDIVASLPESKRMNYVVGDMLVSIPFVDAFLIKFIGEVCVQKKTPQNNLETNFDISTPIEKMKIQVQSTKCRRRLSEAEEETRLFLCK
ncbi:uncharacterized protein LOC111989140 [Quercus suber]|uniref:uncharacterized protein LOC111989140 n=1 Tax=Quercus suber TaxID=58331 RepID=UPI0032DF2B1D